MASRRYAQEAVASRRTDELSSQWLRPGHDQRCTAAAECPIAVPFIDPLMLSRLVRFVTLDMVW